MAECSEWVWEYCGQIIFDFLIVISIKTIIGSGEGNSITANINSLEFLTDAIQIIFFYVKT